MWSDTLDKLTADIAARIGSDPNFDDVPVFTERKGDLDNEVLRRLGALKGKDGKFGACIVVQAPIVKTASGQSFNPMLEVYLSILHLENSAINFRDYGTKKSATTLAIATLHNLCLYEPLPFATLLVPDDPFVDPVEHTSADVAYALRYRCSLLVAGIPARLPRPTMTAVQMICPAVITLSCSNAEAQIFWTLDDTYPAPNNAQAALYTEPFTIHEPGNVRACARLLGSFDSSVSSITIT